MTHSEPGPAPRETPGTDAPAADAPAAPADTATDAAAVTTSPLRLTVSWIIVGVPLAYGVVETIRAVLPLFGG